MQTIKTAIIVALLLAMFYGVYTVLNTPPAPPPREIAGLVSEGPELLKVEEGDTGESPADLASVDAVATEAAPTKPRTPTPRPLDDLESRSPVGLDRGGDAASPAPPTPPDDSLPPIAVPDLTAAPARIAKNSSPEKAGPRLGDSADVTPPALVGRSSAPALAVPDTRADDRDQPAPPPTAGPNSPPAQGEGVGSAAPVDGRQGASAAPTADATTGRYAEGVRFNTKEAVFSRAVQAARQEMEEGKWRDALFTLTTAYEDRRMSDEERSQLLDRLDPLAAKVIYSTEHLVERPYEASRGDTLASIAEQYQVPWQLLQRVNGVKNPDLLVPGTKLKVVRGPFRGEVDLARQEITLYLNRLYAGRFPITMGRAPEPGDYLVKAKEFGHTFFAPDQRPVPSDDPTNPYGQIWIDLGRNVAIHGSPAKAEANYAGSISLSPKDADDVFAILSKGSQVTIRR